MKKQTINEVILTQITFSHKKLLQEQSIPLYDNLLSEKQEVLDSILHNDVEQVFITIMKLNSISSKQSKFAGDTQELEKMRNQLATLEQNKLLKLKETAAK